MTENSVNMAAPHELISYGKNNQVIQRIRRLKLGDMQCMAFTENDPPPFYSLNLKKSDYVGLPKGIYQCMKEDYT